MAACNFSIPFSGSVQEVISKARNSVQHQGGTFEGDVQSGNFHIDLLGNTIKGSYIVAGSVMEIIIDTKPIFVPCGTIESFLKNQLGS